jgi:two-component system chemotaxis response regulator CheY
MLNVLIVDDSIINLKLLKAFFNDINDIEIFQAENGEQAIEVVKNNHIDIIYMDIEMPKMNGIEATKEIKKIKPSIIIVAVTAYTIEKYKDIMFKVGVEDYLTKPVDKAFFLNKFDTFRYLAKYRKNDTSTIDKKSDIKIIFNLRDIDSMAMVWDFIITKGQNLFDYCFTPNLLRASFKIADNFAKKSDNLSIILIYQNQGEKINYVLKGIPKINENLTKIKEIISDEFLEHKTQKILEKLKIKYTIDYISFKMKKEDFIEKIENNEEEDFFEDNEWIDLDDDADEFLNLDASIDVERRKLMDYFNTTHRKIHAVDFLKEYETKDFQMMMDDLENIKEDIYIFLDELYEDNLEIEKDLIIRSFNEFALFLNIFGEFEELSTVLNLLGCLLFTVKLDDKEQFNQKKYFIAEYIKAIFNDLLEWNKHVFIDRDAVDIFYINASIFNSYLQLEEMLNTLSNSNNIQVGKKC